MVEPGRRNVLNATGAGSSPGLLAGQVAATGLRHSRAPAEGIRHAVELVQAFGRMENICPLFWIRGCPSA